ncbi:MAG: IPT/TIG domain-containing protein [Candidatus Solibacter sp.]
MCAVLLCVPAASAQQYTIKTLAGTGTAGYAGDSGDPLAAQLNSPSAVVVDSKGIIYIADSANHCIRMVSGSTITTYAGKCGTIGALDGAATTVALFDNPSGLTFDASGNLIVADTSNHLIRKIAGGTVTRVAGDNSLIAAYGGDNGPATSAQLNYPTAVVLDSAGVMYIADTNNSLIRRVDTKGIITTFLGANATNGRLDHPNGLYLDASGALYIGDSNHQSVSRYIAPTLSLFAGNQTADFGGDGGQAKLAQLNKPVGVAGDAAGTIYVADTNNSRIRKITADGIINTIAGRGAGPYSADEVSATAAYLSFPRTIAVTPDGKIYIADTGNHVIRVLTPSASTISVSGVGNAASGVARISPGALASVYGTGFGTATFVADEGFTWPVSAKGVSVKVNGVSAPIYYSSPGQVNFQVPWATPSSGSVSVSVVYNSVSSNTVAVPSATAAPGLFELGGNQAAVLNSDYSVNGPSNGATAGSTILAYLTGSGPVDPAVRDGVPASLTVLSYALANATVTIGGQPATVPFKGLAPGFVGLLQMNIVVPATLAPGTYPLRITIDGQPANSATIAIK